MPFDMFYQHIMMSPIQNIKVKKQDISLWNTDAPGGNKVKLWQKYL